MKPWNSDAVRRGMDHDQVCGVALASIVGVVAVVNAHGRRWLRLSGGEAGAGWPQIHEVSVGGHEAFTSFYFESSR